MRLYHVSRNMSRPQPPRHRESRRAWLSGLAIIVTALVSLFGFWRLSPGPTFLIATTALVGLVIALWVAGKS